MALKKESETVQYDIDLIEWVKCYSKKGGEAMIKGCMYATDWTGSPTLAHEYYLCLEHQGFAGDQAKRNLMALFVDPKDFYILGRAHINVDNVLILLNEHPAFFKQIKNIWLRPGKGGYKELVKMGFKE